MPKPTHPEKRFLFVVCQPGAEKALKAEFAREHPELHFAYSRPGFVTFKADRALDFDFEVSSVFARAYGVSLGKVKAGDPTEAARALVERARPLAAGGKRLRLHVFERDEHLPGDEPPGYEPGKRAARALEALRAAGDSKKLFLEGSIPSDGDLVFDVVAVEENDWWAGAHVHGPRHSPFAGGKPRIELPADSPSRAYLKLEEAILWSGAPVRQGDVAVEIGSAPGGASYALLKRGVQVVGIDPAAMDRKVSASKNFTQIRRPVATVLREELPESVQWLLVDMNVAPSISLFAVDRLGTRMKGTLLGLILTVKLNKWEFAAEIPSMVEHVKAIGMAKVRAAQLSSNRQEITIVGLTRKGLAR